MNHKHLPVHKKQNEEEFVGKKFVRRITRLQEDVIHETKNNDKGNATNFMSDDNHQIKRDNIFYSVCTTLSRKNQMVVDIMKHV